MPKVKIEKELLEKIKIYIEKAGYSSVEEFVQHCIEKELADKSESDSDEDVKDKLKGLGYI